jgi:hypothetical protein
MCLSLETKRQKGSSSCDCTSIPGRRDSSAVPTFQKDLARACTEARIGSGTISLQVRLTPKATLLPMSGDCPR